MRYDIKNVDDLVVIVDDLAPNDVLVIYTILGQTPDLEPIILRIRKDNKLALNIGKIYNA